MDYVVNPQSIAAVEPTAASVTDEWGPWIGWNAPHWNDETAKQMPVEPHEVVRFSNGSLIYEERRADKVNWGAVIVYRIKKEPEVRECKVYYDNDGDFWGGHRASKEVRNAIITLTNGELDIDWADEGETK